MWERGSYTAPGRIVRALRIGPATANTVAGPMRRDRRF